MEENNNSLYFIVRTNPGREDAFLEAINKILEKKEDHGIYAVFSPESVNGYIFVEGESLTKVVDSLRGIPNNKGVLRTEIGFNEIEKYFDKEAEKIIVNERDIVEVVAGPFKGDRGTVTRVVPGKDEVIIEPVDSPVPIPITLSLDDIRVIPSSKEEEEDNY